MARVILQGWNSTSGNFAQRIAAFTATHGKLSDMCMLPSGQHLALVGFWIREFASDYRMLNWLILNGHRYGLDHNRPVHYTKEGKPTYLHQYIQYQSRPLFVDDALYKTCDLRTLEIEGTFVRGMFSAFLCRHRRSKDIKFLTSILRDRKLNLSPARDVIRDALMEISQQHSIKSWRKNLLNNLYVLVRILRDVRRGEAEANSAVTRLTGLPLDIVKNVIAPYQYHSTDCGLTFAQEERVILVGHELEKPTEFPYHICGLVLLLIVCALLWLHVLYPGSTLSRLRF